MVRLQLTKERKILLISGAILLLGGLFYRFSADISDFGAGDELAVKQKAIAKYQHALQEKKILEKNLLNLEKLLKRAESVLLRRDTAALAAVDIQNNLQNIAGRTGAKIDSMRVLKPKKNETENYLVIPVQCSIKASMRQIKEVLYQIESSSRLFRIQDLRLKTINRRDSDDVILATITVAGYMAVSPTIEAKTKP